MAGGKTVAAIFIIWGIGYIIHYFWELRQLEKRIEKMEADPYIQELRAERRADLGHRESTKREHCSHCHTERYDSLYDHCLDCGEYFLYSCLPN